MSDHPNRNQSLEEINQSLYRDGLTDGLPVVPPTDERVEEMLRGTDLPRDHVIGNLGNKGTPITVEQLASNAVMAGCLPTYMPVLVAGARAMADPDSNTIQFSVSTASWAYQWLVNGPVRNALDIESGSGALGPNFRANQTISRALGIAYRNTARIYPGEKDMGVMGNPFKFSLLLAENEESSPWKPYHVTHGFDREDSTITLSGPRSWVQWSPERNTAEHILRGMIRNTPQTMRAGTGTDNPATVLHAISPSNAEELETAGLNKREIKTYLVDNSHYTTDEYSRSFGSPDGSIPPRQLQQYRDPDPIKIVTLGGPGRVNAIIGVSLGGPVTKKIEFPDGWELLLDEYSVERE